MKYKTLVRTLCVSAAFILAVTGLPLRAAENGLAEGDNKTLQAELISTLEQLMEARSELNRARSEIEEHDESIQNIKNELLDLRDIVLAKQQELQALLMKDDHYRAAFEHEAALMQRLMALQEGSVDRDSAKESAFEED